MAQDYHHGVRVEEINQGARPIRAISTAIVGVVCTAEDADATAFPLDTPVLLTNVVSALGKAGKKGTLYKTLNAIGKQTKPVTIVVRVAEGKDEAETTSNVIGKVTPEGKYTGLKALRSAQASLGVKPRIIGAPLLETQAVGTELAATAQALKGFAYIYAAGARTKEEATAYRKQFSAREVMVIWPNFLAWDDNENKTVEVPATAYAVGLRALIDEATGWHKTLSNVAVNGVTGISIPVSWDLQDPATDAGYLNEQEVTTLINRNGYRFWRTRPARDCEIQHASAWHAGRPADPRARRWRDRMAWLWQCCHARRPRAADDAYRAGDCCDRCGRRCRGAGDPQVLGADQGLFRRHVRRSAFRPCATRRGPWRSVRRTRCDRRRAQAGLCSRYRPGRKPLELVFATARTGTQHRRGIERGRRLRPHVRRSTRRGAAVRFYAA